MFEPVVFGQRPAGPVCAARPSSSHASVFTSAEKPAAAEPSSSSAAPAAAKKPDGRRLPKKSQMIADDDEAGQRKQGISLSARLQPLAPLDDSVAARPSVRTPACLPGTAPSDAGAQRAADYDDNYEGNAVQYGFEDSDDEGGPPGAGAGPTAANPWDFQTDVRARARAAGQRQRQRLHYLVCDGDRAEWREACGCGGRRNKEAREVRALRARLARVLTVARCRGKPTQKSEKQLCGAARRGPADLCAADAAVACAARRSASRSSRASSRRSQRHARARP
jgi:hypothetical protein